MPQKYANSRKPQTTGNSVCFTVPLSYAKERGIVDQDGRPRDIDFEVIETDDGGLKYRPKDD